MFPVRAQCFVIYSPDPSSIPPMGRGLNHSTLIQRIGPNDFIVSFEGCGRFHALVICNSAAPLVEVLFKINPLYTRTPLTNTFRNSEDPDEMMYTPILIVNKGLTM